MKLRLLTLVTLLVLSALLGGWKWTGERALRAGAPASAPAALA